MMNASADMTSAVVTGAVILSFTSVDTLAFVLSNIISFPLLFRVAAGENDPLPGRKTPAATLSGSFRPRDLPILSIACPGTGRNSVTKITLTGPGLACREGLG